MDGISWPVLGISYGSPKDFVRFWEKLYSGDDEQFYQDNIGQPLTEHRIDDWFVWKNGGIRLSENKTKAVCRFRQERIGHDANADTLTAFLNRDGGVIYRIFWLHLQHPQQFPIYDQHAHRAMAFLLKWPNLEIPSQDSAKVRTYLGDYRPFFARFDGCNHRQVDRALWTFGRFVGEYRAIIIDPAND